MPHLLPFASQTAVPALLDRHNFQRTLRRGTVGLILALTLPLLVLLGLVVHLVRTAQWAAESDRAIAAGHQVQSLLIDMETGLRGYQLTGQRRFLDPMAAAQTRFEDDLADFELQIERNGARKEVRAGVQDAIASWRAYAEEALRQTPGAVIDADSVSRGKTLMDAIRGRIEAVIRAEERQREARTAALKNVVATLLGALALTALLGIPALTWWLWRLWKKTSVAYETSLVLTERRAEELHVSLRSIGDAVLATDGAGAVAFLNPEAERLTGWSNAEARGRSLAEVLPIFNERTGEPAVNPVDRVLREKRVVGLANHTVLRPRGGKEIPIEDSAAPIFAADGSIRGVILVFHDVSEKHARDLAFQRTEWLSRTALEVAEAGAYSWEVERDHVTADAIMGRLFGIAPAAREAGTSVQAYLAAIVPEYLPMVQAAIAKSVSTGADFEVEYRVNTEMGGERWLNVRGRMEPDATGKPARLVGLVQDITERRIAAAALMASEVRLRLVLESATDFAVLTLDLAGLVTLWNPGAERIFGWSAEEILGQSGAQIFTEEDRAAGAPIQEMATAAAVGRAADERWHLRRDGSRFFASGVMMPLRDPSGKTLGFLKFARDHTEQQLAEKEHARLLQETEAARAQAVAASGAKDIFLAALSHELRTPLTPILMTAAALREDERLPAEVRSELAMIERNISLEARLIDDLLDLTRISKGKLQLREESCDAHTLIGLAVEIVRDEAQSKPVSLTLDLLARRSSLRGDPARLQQVFWNLLRNAIKFTPIGGSVRIRTRDSDSARLLIEVIDTGVGISSDALEAIFSPFEQASRRGDHRFGGLGLGLTIARAIVELHGGSIRAESAGVDCGTTFTVELPDAVEQRTGATDATAHRDLLRAGEDAVAAPSLRLLLIEDHEPTLIVLSRLLTRIGHVVSSANCVAAGIALGEANAFDLVISDLGLPDGTGFEAMVKLRLLQPGLRGIALSGYGMEDDVQRSREAGFTTHLIKPVNFDQLRRALREVTAAVVVP